jgi:DNA polymerase delta subunit 4
VAKSNISSSVYVEEQSKVHQILRTFDLSYEYGPCIGVSRLTRWERAYKLGLNPPPEVWIPSLASGATNMYVFTKVKEILDTHEGQTLDDIKEPVFFSEGL